MMNNLILSELETIKWLIGGVLFCLSLISINQIATVIHTVRFRKSEIEEGLRNTFISDCHRHEDSGEYESLYQLAWKRNSDYPQDPTARWFLGIAHYRQKQWGQALTAFKELQALDSAWQKYAVEEYVEEIKLHLTGPKPTASQ